MSMESCRECAELVSSEARRCPHCGAPHPTGGRSAPEEPDARSPALPELEAEPVQAEQQNAERPRIGGWLAFFIFTLVMGSIIELLDAVAVAMPWELIYLAVGVWGLVVTVLLFRRSPSAPRQSELLLGTFMSLSAIWLVFGLLAGCATVSKQGLLGFLPNAAWFAYFKRSKRVRATFNVRPRAEPQALE